MDMLYGNVRLALVSRHGEPPLALGINPHGPMWTRVCEMLAAEGDPFEGDLKKQEHCVSVGFIQLILHWMGSQIDPPLEPEIAVRVAHSLGGIWHLFSGLLYRRLHGHPSGHLLTVELNSISLWLALMLSIIKYTSCTVDAAIRFFTLVYGDDNLGGMRGQVTFEQLTAGLLHYGFIMTPADKAMRGVAGYRPTRDKMVFLKRSVSCYVEHEGRRVYIAQLAKASILKSIAYRKRDDKDGTKWVARVLSAIREAAKYDRAFYDYVVDLALRATAQLGWRVAFGGRDVAIPNYDAAFARVISDATKGCSDADEDFFGLGSPSQA